jgi:hypothetical protein
VRDAFLEESGDMVAVFNLETYRPDKWSLKHRIGMRDALGRNDLVCGDGGSERWLPYMVVALDLEREVLLLTDGDAKKLLSYNINTGNHRVIQDACVLAD